MGKKENGLNEGTESEMRRGEREKGKKKREIEGKCTQTNDVDVDVDGNEDGSLLVLYTFSRVAAA